MKLEISKDRISWDLDGTPFSIRVENLDHALFGEDQNVIAALVSESPTSQKIIIYEPNGTIRHEIEQPKDHRFNCLGSNRGKDLAVLTKVEQFRWHDWWFSINAQQGVLEMLGEGR